MNVFRLAGAAAIPIDAKSFSGTVRSRRLALDESGLSVHAYRVEFDAFGRTNWHRHSGPQWLFVIDGRVRVQKWGEPAHDAHTGDAVVIEPGEKHWHGAAPGSHGTHLAVNVNAETEWLEPVSDDQYRG